MLQEKSDVAAYFSNKVVELKLLTNKLYNSIYRWAS